MSKYFVTQNDGATVIAKAASTTQKGTTIKAWHLDASATVVGSGGQLIPAAAGDYIVYEATTGKIDVVKASEYASFLN